MERLLTIRESLKALKPELTSKFHVSSLGLFGSVVRDDFKSDSDIDIIVDFSLPVGVEFIDLANYIEKKLNCKIDLVSRRAIKDKYFKAIEPEIVYV